MTLFQTTLALFCVLLIAVGQLLFKLVGNISGQGHPLSIKVLLFGGLAIGIYGAATVLWIFLLRSAELSKAYPWMALSYILVAVGSFVFFREAISPMYIAGLGLIIAGVLVISQAA